MPAQVTAISRAMHHKISCIKKKDDGQGKEGHTGLTGPRIKTSAIDAVNQQCTNGKCSPVSGELQIGTINLGHAGKDGTGFETGMATEMRKVTAYLDI